ncbi:YhcB family protein [Halomonas sp. H5]|uniref:YhcB family protein n=1 Tax=Halomonas sp. H5 TaxID=3423910 RepID=UPI003D363ECE
MYESNIDWILAIASGLAGIGIGALGYHLLNANVARNQKVRQRLAETELELTQVKDSLNDHFSRAADLLQGIQRQSQELQQQLAQSAERFCDDDHLKRRLHASDAAELAAEGETEGSAPPRDYADGTHGTLSEDFGLRRSPEEAEAASATAQPPRY